MSWLGFWKRGKGKFGRGQDDTELGQAQPRDIFLMNRIERTDEIENTGAKGTGKYIEFADIARNNQVLYADGVAHIQNYDFEAKVHGYILSGITYENPITAFTLGAAHSTESRIDVVAGTFGLDGVGKIIIIPGAGIVGTPVKPELTNYDTQIELTFITVGASTTEPAQVTDLLIYDENVEFTTADNTGGARVDFDDTADPYVNSKAIACASFAHGDQMTFTQGSVFNVYDYKNFQLQIERITTKWVKNATLEVAYYDTGTSLVVSSWVKIGSDSKSKLNYKFDSAIDGYQNVLIPTSAFVFTSSTADRIIIRKNDNKGVVSFRLDLIKFQIGISDPPTISAEYTLSSISSDIFSLLKDGLIVDSIDLTPYADQNASEVVFTPYLTIGSADTQAAVQELKDEVDLLTFLQNIVEDITPQAGGELDMQAHSLGGTVQTATGDGTTTIDWKLGNMFDFQFGAFNEVFIFTAPTKPGTFILKLVQDSAGSRTVTWPATVKWVDGTAVVLTTTLTTGTDIITFYYNGTSYFAVQSLDFS